MLNITKSEFFAKRDAEILKLFDMGHNCKDIGLYAGITQSGVKQALSRARKVKNSLRLSLG